MGNLGTKIRNLPNGTTGFHLQPCNQRDNGRAMYRGSYLRVSFNIASIYGNDDLSSKVGRPLLPITASIKACAFCCTSG